MRAGREAKRQRAAPRSARRPRPALLPVVLAFAAGASMPFWSGVVAWPEMVVPAYFVDRGLVLYRDIFFPHTPALIGLTAAAGALFGFSAAVLRALVAVSTGATTALVVAGVARRRRGEAWLAAAAGVPLVIALTAATEGPALWPDAWMAPLVLGAALWLERFERAGRRGDLVAAGLTLGLAILVKQTSAWVAVAAVLWLLLASRARSWSSAWRLVAAFAAPYALFVAGWYVAFGTWSHLRWTLVVLLQGLGAEVAAPVTGSDVGEIAALLLAVPAYALLKRALPRPARSAGPAVWLAVGCLGMAYPRGGMLHLAASAGLVALLLGRSGPVAAAFVKRWARRTVPAGRVAVFAAGAACALSAATVTLVGGGGLALWQVGGPVLYWDDPLTRSYADAVRARVAPGSELLVFGVPRETLYPLTGTVFPGGVYVNPEFWYCLNKEGVDARVTGIVAARPGLPVLFREPPPSARELRDTQLYRFLDRHTATVSPVDDTTGWRAVVAVTGGPG